jgi:hypothetical protein
MKRFALAVAVLVLGAVGFFATPQSAQAGVSITIGRPGYNPYYRPYPVNPYYRPAPYNPYYRPYNPYYRPYNPYYRPYNPYPYNPYYRPYGTGIYFRF